MSPRACLDTLAKRAISRPLPGIEHCVSVSCWDFARWSRQAEILDKDFSSAIEITLTHSRLSKNSVAERHSPADR